MWKHYRMGKHLRIWKRYHIMQWRAKQQPKKWDDDER